MFIEETTYKALHLELIFEKLQPVSALGLKAKQNSLPFFSGDEALANEAYEKIAFVINQLKIQPNAITALRDILLHFHNIELILRKVNDNAVLELFELQEIKHFLYFFLQLNKQLQAFGLQPLPHAQKLTGLFSLLAPGNQNTPSFFLHDSYSDNFTSTKRGIEILENTLQKELKRLSEKAAKLLDKKIVPEEIVVSRFQKDIVETLFQNDLFYLKSENFANYCFGLRKNETMIECEQKIDLLREKLTIFEAEIRKNLTREVSNSLKDLIDSQKKIGEFDWNLAKANFAISFGCSIPKVTTEKEYHLPQARNLPIAWELEAKSFAYQPVSMTIENQLNVLTGANMAGKTTLLKMLGQIQFLAAFAIPVPTENARLPLVDFIFFSGLYEERMDLSSFGTEIVMLQEKMKKDGFGLFLIDEFARGTNPAEGEAISKAILEEFSKKNCVTIFSTHFHAPTTVLTTNHYQIVGLTEKDISLIKKETKKDLSERLKQLHQFMNYDVIKVSPQTEPPRAALLVAELLGVDEHIIKKAYQFLEDK